MSGPHLCELAALPPDIAFVPLVGLDQSSRHTLFAFENFPLVWQFPNSSQKRAVVQETAALSAEPTALEMGNPAQSNENPRRESTIQAANKKAVRRASRSREEFLHVLLPERQGDRTHRPH